MLLFRYRDRSRIDRYLAGNDIEFSTAVRSVCVRAELIDELFLEAFGRGSLAVNDEKLFDVLNCARPFHKTVHVRVTAYAGELFYLGCNLDGLAEELDLFRSFNKGASECI